MRPCSLRISIFSPKREIRKLADIQAIERFHVSGGKGFIIFFISWIGEFFSRFGEKHSSIIMTLRESLDKNISFRHNTQQIPCFNIAGSSLERKKEASSISRLLTHLWMDVVSGLAKEMEAS